MSRYRRGVEVRLLGPLEVRDGGTVLALGPRRQRALLARLALAAGRTVPAEQLLDDLWGEQPPGSAAKMIQVYVSGLRKVLPPGRLATRPPGYALRLEPGEADLSRFERLALDGRAALGAGDAGRAAGLLADALDLWRGPPLAEFTEPFADLERARLEDFRLACEEDRLDAELALGRHSALVGELEALAARHPLRERLRAQLVLALYRSGRQAEALAAYTAFRRHLADELGLDPSPALRELEGRILAQDPALAVPATAPGERLPSAALPVAGPRADPEPVAATLPGRERELRRLEQSLTRAGAGARRVVVVTGERGIGKSTLVDAFLAALPAGVLVARGQAHRHQGTPEPYGPVIDALGRLADGPDGEAVRAVLAERAPAWLAHLPWITEDAAPVRGVTAGRMVRELVEALQRLAADRTVVLALEDLEWSDPSTRTALEALAGGRTPARLLVLLTCTDDAHAEAGDPVGRVVRELCLRGPGDLVALGGLSEAALAASVAARFPGREVPDGLAATLWERSSGGHPLLAGQLLDHWLATEAVADDGTALRLPGGPERLREGVPVSLRAAVADRLAGLEAPLADALRAAAVAGPVFRTDVLAAALDVPDAEAARRCARLAAAGLLRVTGEGADGPWAFVHALVQEATVAATGRADRTLLHRRIGAHLGAAGSAPAAVVAHHLLEAGEAADAVRFLRRAAEDAFARRAHGEGAGLVREALVVLPRLPAGPERDRLEIELRSRLGQALVATDGWDAAEAEHALDRARALAEELGDRELLVSVLLTLATLQEVRGEPAAALRTAEAGARLAGGVLDRRLDAQELLACSHFHQGAFERALQHAEQGTDLFTEGEQAGHYDDFPALLGDNAGVACHDWAALATWFLGRPDTALRRARHALRLAHEPERAYGLAPAFAQLAMIHQLRREPSDTLRAAETTIKLAQAHGYAFREATGRVLAGWATAALGSPREGIAELARGLAAARATGARMEDPYFQSLLADASLEAADVDGGLAAVEEGLRVARRERIVFCDPELLRLRAGLLRAGGAPADEVVAELERAIALAREQRSRVLELRAAVDLASLRWEAGAPADARRVVAEVYERFHEGFATPDLREAAAILRAPTVPPAATP